jgi:hypothetical protein
MASQAMDAATTSLETVLPFVVPSTFDSVYYNKPDTKSLLMHSLASSYTQPGFQAILCFYSKPIVPCHLGLPPLDNYEDKVFLQVASESQPFLLHTQVAHGQSMQINVTEYLILLQFIQKEWSRLESKLQYQLTTMRQGTDPIHITARLVFYNNGSSIFKTNLSSRLVFKAWIESGDPKGTIHAGLEKKMDGADAGTEWMPLPMESLVTLAKDAVGFKALTKMLAYYKSHLKKSIRSVV